ncbi:hypothetical protein DFQ28_010535 [Apophysomyces sp. BC1034]|nr:hypothetical protein DFQ30_010297 [Apophysomyces sp. BC1015]KAG0169867.1 hypothetical protein DFQ29_009522 [Apophysomyces sp. BC1021]KAG0184759.1 hypothetical protein DFQ28_010535 [Apophysomyces sp. BC1034]
MDMMQKEMHDLQLGTTRELTPETQSSQSSGDQSLSSVDSMPSYKRQRIIAQTKNVRAILADDVLADQDQSWTLTVTNGKLSIRTHIKTHGELLINLQRILTTLEFQDKMPLNMQSQASSVGILLKQLVWKKYGKSRFKSITKDIPLQMETIGSLCGVVIKQSSFTAITLKLLNAYFECSHLLHMKVHRHTFLRLFLDPSCADPSPAVMALCAFICLIQCKYITQVVDSRELPDYAQFYFNRARELLADRFDDINLEVFTSYTCMAYYKVRLFQFDDCRRYLDMALRMSHMLEPLIKATDDIGQQAMFHRLCIFAQRVQRILAVTNFSKPQHGRHPEMAGLLNVPDFLVLQATSEDSEQEKRFIQMHNRVLQLRKQIHSTIHMSHSDDLVDYVGTFGHLVEMIMRHWYNELPSDFRLSHPLFEDNVCDEVYFLTLELECAHNPIPILTTLKIYNEYLIMGKSYMPKSATLDIDKDSFVNTLRDGFADRESHKRHPREKRWIEKLQHLRKVMEFDGTDEEFIETVTNAIRPGEGRLNLPLIHISVKCAFNTVRLLQFMRSKYYACYFDYRTALNVWEVLIRALRLTDRDLQLDIPRIHANLLICLDMMREEISSVPGYNKDCKFIEKMESMMQREAFGFDA